MPAPCGVPLSVSCHESLPWSYVTQVLAPIPQPGDLVVADNLSCHKRVEVRSALRAVGARLMLLPKYSPDLNPIEQVFAKLKHLLRKAAA